MRMISRQGVWGKVCVQTLVAWTRKLWERRIRLSSHGRHSPAFRCRRYRCDGRALAVLRTRELFSCPPSDADVRRSYLADG